MLEENAKIPIALPANATERLLLKTKFNIHVKSASLDVHDMISGLNGNYNCQVKLIEDGGNGILNKLVSFNFMSNQYYAITDGEGIVNLKANLDEGTCNGTVSSEIAGNAEWQNVEVPIDNNMQTLKMDKNGFVAIPINKKFKVGKNTIESVIINQVLKTR